MKRKICVITGTRADYGIYYSVLKHIEKSDNLKLYLIATCMHLMKEFGYTVTEIEKDGFKVYEKIDISYKEDNGEALASAIGRAVIKFSKSFNKIRPDFVVVLGDRGEMLAAAIAANYLNIPIAHIHGGELSGHVDGILRHAITKLAHLHFASTNESKERILRLGEEPWRVIVSGAPALDRILGNEPTTKKELINKYELDKEKPLILIVQHPVNSESEDAGDQIDTTLKAIKELGMQSIVIYPNADAGGRKMIEVIKKYEKEEIIRSFVSIPHRDYLGLMKVASVLVGNSSSGIIEAASFGLPVVNIGNRQQGRERNRNVIDVSHSQSMIVAAIKKAIFDKKFKTNMLKIKNVYGKGHAGEVIAKVLGNVKIDTNLLQKYLTY